MTKRGVVLLLALGGGGVGAFVFVSAMYPWEHRGDSGSAAEIALSDPSGVPLSIPGLLEKRETQSTARASVVIDASSGRILAEHDSTVMYPIASLTKLMSAMVALDHGVSLDREVTILPEEFTVGGTLRIVPGVETVTVRDLLYASIVGSANNAALALVRSTGLSKEEFVREMNRKAVALDAEHLSFADPSGLDPRNIGSAYDVARMAAVAWTKYPLIRDAASRGSYPIVTRNTHREHTVKNSNGLFERAASKFQFSKTGYLDEALYCLVLGRETPMGLIVAVTLGHPSDIGSQEETLSLLTKDPGHVAGAAANQTETP